METDKQAVPLLLYENEIYHESKGTAASFEVETESVYRNEHLQSQIDPFENPLVDDVTKRNHCASDDMECEGKKIHDDSHRYPYENIENVDIKLERVDEDYTLTNGSSEMDSGGEEQEDCLSNDSHPSSQFEHGENEYSADRIISQSLKCEDIDSEGIDSEDNEGHLGINPDRRHCVESSDLQDNGYLLSCDSHDTKFDGKHSRTIEEIKLEMERSSLVSEIGLRTFDEEMVQSARDEYGHSDKGARFFIDNDLPTLTSQPHVSKPNITTNISFVSSQPTHSSKRGLWFKRDNAHYDRHLSRQHSNVVNRRLTNDVTKPVVIENSAKSIPLSALRSKHTMPPTYNDHPVAKVSRRTLTFKDPTTFPSSSTNVITYSLPVFESLPSGEQVQFQRYDKDSDASSLFLPQSPHTSELSAHSYIDSSAPLQSPQSPHTSELSAHSYIDSSAPLQYSQEMGNVRNTELFDSLPPPPETTTVLSHVEWVCNDFCVKKCKSFFSPTDREMAKSIFNSLSWAQRRAFIAESVQKIKVKQNDSKKQKNSYIYTLTEPNGTRIPVCKQFFLTTLGFHPSNDTIIYNTFRKIRESEENGTPSWFVDGRGKTLNAKRIDYSKIASHINSYFSSQLDDSLGKIPRRQFLSQGLTVWKIYKDYKTLYKHEKVSYSSFLSIFKQMNIGLTASQNIYKLSKRTFQSLHKNESLAPSSSSLPSPSMPPSSSSLPSPSMPPSSFHTESIGQCEEDSPQSQSTLTLGEMIDGSNDSLTSTRPVPKGLVEHYDDSLSTPLFIQKEQSSHSQEQPSYSRPQPLPQSFEDESTEDGFMLPQNTDCYSGDKQTEMGNSPSQQFIPTVIPKVKWTCSDLCVKKCKSVFSLEDREKIKSVFNELTWLQRRAFIADCVEKSKVKQNDSKRRKNSFIYTLKTNDGFQHPVCKQFFLTTLGFHPSNDKIIFNTFKQISGSQEQTTFCFSDGRGKTLNAKKIDDFKVMSHIESYLLNESLCEESDVTNVCHLPTHVTVKGMYKDFKSMYSDVKISYASFHRAFKKMKAGTSVLQNRKNDFHKSAGIQQNYEELMGSFSFPLSLSPTHIHKKLIGGYSKDAMPTLSPSPSFMTKEAIEQSPAQPLLSKDKNLHSVLLPPTQNSDAQGSVQGLKLFNSYLSPSQTSTEFIQMKWTCNDLCVKKCNNFFSLEDREIIRSVFNGLSWSQRRSFIASCVKKTEVKKRKGSRKKNSFIYTLTTPGGIRIPVCKQFFLTTLGYHPSNDKIIVNTFKQIGVSEENTIPCFVDGRGKTPKAKKIDDSKIMLHIETYLSNEHEEGEGNVSTNRCLPGHITVRSMYQDFKSMYIDERTSYPSFYRIFKKMGIRMTSSRNRNHDVNRSLDETVQFKHDDRNHDVNRSLDETVQFKHDDRNHDVNRSLDETVQFKHVNGVFPTSFSSPSSMPPQPPPPSTYENCTDNSNDGSLSPSSTTTTTTYQEQCGYNHNDPLPSCSQSLSQTEVIEHYNHSLLTPSHTHREVVNRPEFPHLSSQPLSNDGKDSDCFFSSRSPNTCDFVHNTKMMDYFPPLSQQTSMLVPTVNRSCSNLCAKKCNSVFSPGDRERIRLVFLGLNWSQRRAFIASCVEKTDVKQKTGIRRKYSFIYTFTTPGGIRIPVCKQFFLTTLGYHPSNDKIIVNTFKQIRVSVENGAVCFVDGRGKSPRARKIDDSKVRSHIESYLANQPQCGQGGDVYMRHLPSNITVMSMYKDYKAMYDDENMSYPSFYRTFKKMDIDVAVLLNKMKV